MFAGTPEPAAPSLRALIASEHQVIAVITRPPARSGRGRTLRASPVAEVAAEFGIPILTPVSARDPTFLTQLEELGPDAAAVVAYGALLPQPVLDVPTHGWVNLHFSLLPTWRGAAPVYAAIKHGDEITGASTFLLEAGLDTGPVFGTVTETIEPTDTTGDLLARLATAGARLLVRTMDGLADGSLSPVGQPSDGISHIGKVTGAQAEIDWQIPAFAIDRLIRALTPDPGAWTTFRGDRIGLGPVELAPLPTDGRELAPGELSATKKEVLVGTASGALRLGLVTPPGKKPMPAPDWARGARTATGEQFRPSSTQESDPGPQPADPEQLPTTTRSNTNSNEARS